jgi:putative ABC transport system permease protein
MMQISGDPANVSREVVGVVGDVRDLSLARAPVPEVFGPYSQNVVNALGIVVRIAEGSRLDAISPAVRQRLAALDPNVPMVRPQLLSAAVDATIGNSRIVSLLTSVFAFVAALLASVGVYSLIAYSVAQRTREIGIRVALGADRLAVVRMIVGEGLALAAGGVIIGLVAAYFLTQTLQTLLYEVRPADPVVLASTCAGVFVVAALASVVPAIRALRVDAMTALRAE